MARTWIQMACRLRVLTSLTALLLVCTLAFLALSKPPEKKFDGIKITETQRVLEPTKTQQVLEPTKTQQMLKPTKTQRVLEPIYGSHGAIPKIIHQTFTTSKIFTDYRKYIEHCLKLNPDWEYYLWTDEDIVAFINDHYPFFMRKYLVFKMHVQRGDSIRYMALHHFGGIYIDMDVCVKPFFPSLENQTVFVDQEAKEHAVILYGKNFSAMNSAMGSVPGHPFFLRLVFAMMEVDDKQGGAGATTGPDLLTDQLHRWWADNATRRHEVTLLDPPVFSPIIDDGLHNFKSKCATVQRGTPKAGDSAAQQLHQKRLQLCKQYAQRNWKHDLTGPETVGRHLFLHLGYRWSKRNPNYFDISEVAKNVKFYSRDKSSMISRKGCHQ